MTAAAAVAVLQGVPAARDTAVSQWPASLAGLLRAPTPTAIAWDPPTPQPTLVALPGAPRTLLPGVPRKLLPDGCCAGAWWADDSSSLRFIDRPADAATAGLYEVDVWPPDSRPVVLPVESLTSSLRDPVVVRQIRDYALVEDLASGDKWPLPTDGNPVLLSPDGAWAVWWDAPSERMQNESLVTVFSSDIYGFDIRELCRLWGGQVVGFAPDNRSAVVSGRQERATAERVLQVIDVQTGAVTELARGHRLAEAVLSADRSWVSYAISLQRDDTQANGIWVTPLAGGAPRKLPFEGAYRWRDGRRIVYVPLEPSAPSRSAWQIDVETMDSAQLFGDADTWLSIANNDWSISPDGQTMAFLREHDRSLWVVDLPD